MSMNCTLSRVTQEQAAAMRANPAAAADVLSCTDDVPQEQPGFLARLFGKKPPPRRQRELPFIGDDNQYDLDRQWQILHFLFTGSVEGGEFPASFICNDGEEIGEDGGYGRPRLFTNAQARRIADYLSACGEQDVRRRYRAEDIEANEIYYQAPESEEEQREEVRLLCETVGEMARFIDETARRGCAMVIEIW